MSNKWRQRTWLGLLDSDRVGHYLYAVANKARRRYHYCTVLAVIASLGNLVLLASDTTPPHFSSVTSILVVLLFYGIILGDYSRKSALAEFAAKDCSSLSQEWRRLWAEVDDISEDKALRKVEALESKGVYMTQFVPGILGLDEKLNQKAAEYVNDMIRHEYPEIPTFLSVDK